jgi:hypothetical protein
MSTKLIDAVANWKQEGVNEPLEYLYERPEFASLLSGETKIAIGGKGSGKSTLINYIKKHGNNPQSTSHVISMEDLKISSLAGIAKEPTEIAAFWRELLALAAISALHKHAPFPLANSLGEELPKIDTIGEWVSELLGRDISLNISKLQQQQQRSMSWQDRSYRMRRYFGKLNDLVTTPVTVYLVFDKFDYAFRGDATADTRRSYLDILSGFVNAVISMKDEDAFNTRILVRPILLMRSDILEKVPSTDRTKRADVTVALDWHPGEIQRLLAHRLSASGNLDAKDFRTTWHTFLEPFRGGKITDKYDGTGRDKPPFEWVELRTFWRPRDYVVFLQCCARLAQRQGTERVTFDQFVAAEYDYAPHALKHIEDEGTPHMPDFTDRVAQLTRLVLTNQSNKRNYTRDELATAFHASKDETASLIRSFFDFGAFGYVSANYNPQFVNTRYVFSFKNQNHPDIDGQNLIQMHPAVHRAMCRS